MDIAIIGSGNVGRALASNLTRSGHRVVLAARDAASTRTVAAELGVESAATPADAARDAEVVVLAVPYASVEELAGELAPVVGGKVVIDPTNPLTPTYDGLVTEGGPSAAERIAAWLPDARVVKAFNTLFASKQADPIAEGTQLDGLVAGDDEEARQLVLGLVRDAGLRPIDAGPLARAKELEALAWLNIALQPVVGNTWATGWRLVGVPAGLLEERQPVGAAAGGVAR